MVSFKTVRRCCTDLYKDKTVALYVSYFWLYFSLFLLLECMFGRVQLITFLSIKKEINSIFFSFYAEMKENIYFISLELWE